MKSNAINRQFWLSSYRKIESAVEILTDLLHFASEFSLKPDDVSLLNHIEAFIDQCHTFSNLVLIHQTAPDH